MTSLTAKPYGWTPTQVLVWSRAAFKCEYCHRNLLSSVMAYDSGELDHIDPRRSRQATWNLALCCRMCNRIKRHFVPQGMPDPRNDRIGAIRAFQPRIKEGWRKKHAILRAVRALIRGTSGAAA
ncbi:MAG TPA: HNH endonuclease signature motif containing protein [Gemmatimonadales bacterium]|nr:HNH endonuclease signature motif containing protein [Gemmatimonadales bacterium]